MGINELLFTEVHHVEHKWAVQAINSLYRNDFKRALVAERRFAKQLADNGVTANVTVR